MIVASHEQIALLRALKIGPLAVGNASIAGCVAKAILGSVHDRGVECDGPLERLAIDDWEQRTLQEDGDGR